MLLCCLALPATARADGIDLPILLGVGVGIVLPLLLFNATVEAPIVGRFIGVKFSDLWYPWFKANIWSLLGGIPAMMINGAIGEYMVPTELGARVRAYPAFSVVQVLVFFVVTVLVEFICVRRIVRLGDGLIPWRRLIKAVVLANVASYAVLGPVFFILSSPRSDIREFAPNAAWGKQPGLVVLAVGPSGHLEAATLDGRDRRVVIPHEVRDYVVSVDLVHGLYRGKDDRFFFFQNGTNIAIPELGFWCRAPEMDFSPNGRYAAFFDDETHRLRVFDTKSGQFKDVYTLGEGTLWSLVWSLREDTLYLKSGKDWWEISLGSDVGYAHPASPPQDFANHFGKVGNAWSRSGVHYMTHKDGSWSLFAYGGWGSRVIVSREKQRVMDIKDPAGGLVAEEAVFIGGNEILVELGNYVYLADVAAKRMGPVMRGEKLIALTAAFSKQVDF